jgi:hypothetical protein
MQATMYAAAVNNIIMSTQAAIASDGWLHRMQPKRNWNQLPVRLADSMINTHASENLMAVLRMREYGGHMMANASTKDTPATDQLQRPNAVSRQLLADRRGRRGPVQPKNAVHAEKQSMLPCDGQS